MALTFLLPNTDDEVLNINSVEITFSPDADKNNGADFVEELIALSVKYETALSTFVVKEK